MSFKRCVGVCLRHLSAVVRCDSTERLRNSLDYLRSVLNDSTSFKLIYRYAFDFARVSQAKCHLSCCQCEMLWPTVGSCVACLQRTADGPEADVKEGNSL